MKKALLFLAAAASAAPLASGPATFPALVELYTSQGCSSCPPAEELLSGWGLESFRRGEIVPLAFHVDYWDRLGWKDPFGSADFTDRQRRYARALRSDTVYTPQMIVAGRDGFVGSDESQARAAAARAGRSPAWARIDLRRDGPDRVAVDVRPLAPPDRPVRVMLAVFENGLLTKVPRGENAGRTLRGDFVVRRLEDLGEWSGKGPLHKETDLRPDPAWKRENLGIAVFLQDPASLEAGAAAALYPL